MVIERGGKTISTIETGNRNYTFTKSGTYTVTCYPDSSPENHRNLCRTTVEVGGQCGNGVVENGEQCDDGNNNNGDGCNNKC